MILFLSYCHYAGIRSICTGKAVMVVDDKITNIPQREFYGWTKLINVTFKPTSELTSIGNNAFDGCNQLVTINLPPKLDILGMGSFQSCSSLLEIWLPGSLTNIDSYSFAYCVRLHTIIVDEDINVQTLSGSQFRSTSITTFAIWKNLISLTASVFMSCNALLAVTNPHDNPYFTIDDNGLVYSGSQLVFAPIRTTGDVVISATVTSVADYACRAIMADSILFESGSQLASFGYGCFTGAEMSIFTFPDSGLVFSISTAMFRGCLNLRVITIPKGITTIGTSAFYLSALEFIEVEEGHPSFVSKNGIMFSIDMTAIIVCPPQFDAIHYTIPKSVTMIATTAFHGTTIQNITFEADSELKTLGNSAFRDLYQSSFAFDSNCPLTTIPTNCFEGSLKLTSIELPRQLQSIEGSAFSNTLLVEFIIPTDANHLTSIDGVLYSKDYSILYRFPPAKTDQNYEVPSIVTTIGSSAFATCQGISTLVFAHDSRLNTVEASAFASSTIITVIFGDDSDDVTFEANCFASSAVQYVTLPGRMRNIKKDLFKNCGDLVGITLPETATTIETGAFENCKSLAKLSIPRFCQIRDIPLGAFTGTHALTELELPYLVQTVAEGSLPSALEKITIWGPLSESIILSIKSIPTLRSIGILCGLSLDTTSFVASNVIITHICFTKKRNQCLTWSLRFIITCMYQS